MYSWMHHFAGHRRGDGGLRATCRSVVRAVPNLEAPVAAGSAVQYAMVGLGSAHDFSLGLMRVQRIDGSGVVRSQSVRAVGG